MMEGETHRVIGGASEELKFVLYSLDLLLDPAEDRFVGWEVHNFVVEDYADDV